MDYGRMLLGRTETEHQTTDLTDAEWERVRHLVEVDQIGPGPRRSVCLRTVLNAVLYQQTTGCQWRQLPASMPPRSTVHGYFRRWSKTGVLAQVVALLAHEHSTSTATYAVMTDY